MTDELADICLLLEGTYPYVSGGVSQWAHDLIRSNPSRSFYLTCLLPPDAQPKLKYSVPPNVIGITQRRLQELPAGAKRLPKKDEHAFFSAIETALLQLQHQPQLKVLQTIINLLNSRQEKLGYRILLDSYGTWRMLTRVYNASMGSESFLNFFWSWRGLLGALFTVLLMPYPPARVYHSLCTGYAGLLLSKIHLDTKRPCLVTEHGIYTNERRIEITTSGWLQSQHEVGWAIDKPRYERDLQDLWIDCFRGYSAICYEASDRIITLYEGNQHLQSLDGATPEKLQIIANGIDYEVLSKLSKTSHTPLTVALVGRVVPIKDIKTYLLAASKIKEEVPSCRILVIGPLDEDEGYYQECRSLCAKSGLEPDEVFTGRLKITEILPEIDVLVLTSISEAQPLSVLEAAALGIPSVVTDVGACRELIEGRSDEDPPLGAGGQVVSLSSPQETAEAVIRLLCDDELRASCGEVMRMRTERYYRLEQQIIAYHEVYEASLTASRNGLHLPLPGKASPSQAEVVPTG